MATKRTTIQFQSALAPLINKFIQEKRACGYKYDTESRHLKLFDIFLCENQLKQTELPKELVSQWIAKKPHEQVSTHHGRVCLIRQFTQFMVRLGYVAYVPPEHFGMLQSSDFLPYIFTQKEIQKIIHAVDKIQPNAHSPTQYLIMPEIFRLLYGCGFRLSEVLKLRVRDVDLVQGVITVREGKFGKDRLVPPALDVIERLKIYTQQIEQNTLEKRTDNAFFFPSCKRSGTAWHNATIYTVFRRILYQCGISHGGRKKGPRVHDLRHTFAVHRLIRWYEEGADLNAKIPFLVAYLGHKDFTGTQKYLHLTAELFPNLTERMNKQFGDVIPARRSS
jgi:site-specific recombinase XerD